MSTTWINRYETWISGIDYDPSATEAFRAGWRANEPSLPTREQIAEVISGGWRVPLMNALEMADAVLAPLNGADR